LQCCKNISLPCRQLIGSFLMCSLFPWLVLVALGRALGRPWLDLGVLFVPFEMPLGGLGSHGIPWGRLGDPSGFLGGPWGCLGVAKAIFSDLSKIGRPIPRTCVYVHAPAHRIKPPGILQRIHRIHRIHSYPAETVLWPTGQAPVFIMRRQPR
jgi:hypothetical protein